jgi:hypothetical protein
MMASGAVLEAVSREVKSGRQEMSGAMPQAAREGL